MHWRQHPGHNLHKLNWFMLLNELIIRKEKNIYTVPFIY